MKILNNYLKLARPRQWLKNIFVFAGLVFAVKFNDSDSIVRTIYGFFAFCFVSSGLYSINDICDKEKDKFHPSKKNRPIASGAIGSSSAAIFSVILLTMGFTIGYKLNINFFFCLVVYFIMTFFYSVYLKTLIIVDVIIIASGFVLRAISGTYIVNVEISEWLFICTFLLALLLGFGKRRNEIITLGNEADGHRKNLKNYSLQLLDYYIVAASSAAIFAYSMYCISERTGRNIVKHEYLKFTIPFVVYAIFRYIFILIFKNIGGEPESLLYKDKGLLISFLLWSVSIIVIISIGKI